MMLLVFYKYIFLNIISLMVMIIILLISVAFLTLLERKLLGYIQYRKGPNKVGYLGIFQPFSDAIKLFMKEVFMIFKSSKYLYYLCPVLSFLMMMLIWMIYPFFTNNYYMNYSMLFMILVMGIGGYIILLMGWSSNSLYSIMGSIRSIAQVLSYEVSFIFIILIFTVLVESYSLIDMIKWQYYMSFFFYLFPIFLVFFISVLAELNRSPMDFIEGESELVSGFNIEYFSGGFALIFIGEYGMIIFFSYLMCYMFINIDKIMYMYMYINVFVILIIFMRGILPRMRYDELMFLCWKIILPLILNYFILVIMFKILLFMLV